MPRNGKPQIGQKRLFEDRRFPRGATKDQVCPPGGYLAVPLALAARRDLGPADKLVYGALGDHLRGAATWVNPGEERLAAMLALSTRSVRRSIRRLEAMGLIEQRRPAGKTPLYTFAPLQRSTGVSPVSFGATGVSPVSFGATGETPVPPGEGADKMSGGGGQNVRPRADKMSAPSEALTPDETPALPDPEALGSSRTGRTAEAQRPQSTAGASLAAGLAPRSAHQAGDASVANPASAAISQAQAWEELLGLDRRARTDAQEEADFEQLRQAAEDLLAGRLGEPAAAAAALQTVAHQIGRREPAARSPAGMFLAEVGRLRLAAMRGIHRKGAGAAELKSEIRNSKSETSAVSAPLRCQIQEPRT